MDSSIPAQSSMPNDQPVSSWRLSNVSLPFHLLAASWILAMLLLGRYSYEQYVGLVQEDRPIEWATVWLFAAAGIVQLRRGIQKRHLFDVLVACFCLFVAGEEFSWGQRILGYGSPEYFLGHNYQQEVNLHNLPGSFVKPKWFLIAALAGYGILLPVMSRFVGFRGLMDRVGATPPPVQLAPWFATCIILLVWYPFTLSGEWVESLAGGLFVASTTLASGTRWIVLSLALIFGVSMTKVTNAVEQKRDLTRSTCAQAELKGLLNDLTVGETGTEKLKRQRTLHKRVWSAVNEGYLNSQSARGFHGTKCSGSTIEETENRRAYVVDPWGMSYWLSVRRVDDGLQRIAVYSFGPNRRRDGSPGAPSGDDMLVVGHSRQEATLEFPITEPTQ